MIPPRALRFFFSVALLFACSRATGEQPATAPVVAPPLSGKLGTPIQLFNGKDIDDWTWVARPPKPGTTQPVNLVSPFAVRDGILHSNGKPVGYLRVSGTFDNYVLTVEQRHIAKGNGGVLFAISGPDKVWPHCLEAQGQNGEEGDIRNIAEFKLNMDPARVEPKRLHRLGPDSEKPVGEWETIEVLVDHGNLTLKVNGQLQNLATYSDGLAGHIGLQAEGAEMEFRKVEVTPIKDRGDSENLPA